MQTLLSKLKGDRTIWLIVFLLSLFSMLAVYSASSALGQTNEYYLLRQASLLFIGFIIMFIAHRVNHSYYSRIAQVLLYLSIPLLFFTLIAGTSINEAARWITVPVLQISFQPSDLAKLALIMYTARMLSKKQHNITNFEKAFMPIIGPIIIVCILIVPADLSTATLLFITSLIILFIGRVSWRHIGITVWLTLSLFAVYLMFGVLTNRGRIDTWKHRFETFVSPKSDFGDNYQATQAKIAIVNGGLVRIAPGKSQQRNFLPQPYSDFIYAIIIEEYGLLGGIIVLGLYLLLLWRCIRIFMKSPGAFGALLAVGLGISLVIQALMNMAVTVNLLPVTGLTLPLVSMGGTSLVFTSLAIGIILSVSVDVEARKQHRPQAGLTT